MRNFFSDAEKKLMKQGEPVVFQSIGGLEPVIAEIWQRKRYDDEKEWTYYYQRVRTQKELDAFPPEQRRWRENLVDDFDVPAGEYKPVVRVFEDLHYLQLFLEHEFNFGSSTVEIEGLNWDFKETKWRAYKVIISSIYLRPTEKESDRCWEDKEKQSDREFYSLIKRAMECEKLSKKGRLSMPQ